MRKERYNEDNTRRDGNAKDHLRGAKKICYRNSLYIYTHDKNPNVITK